MNYDLDYWISQRDMAVAENNDQALEICLNKIQEIVGEIPSYYPENFWCEYNATFGPLDEEGTKHDNHKPRMDLLSRAALEEISKVLGFGAEKYAAHDWRKGFKWSRLYAAALRHLMAHIDGEDKDPESGLSHLAHLGCCVMFLLEHEAKGLGTDDRYNPRKS